MTNKDSFIHGKRNIQLHERKQEQQNCLRRDHSGHKSENLLDIVKTFLY